MNTTTATANHSGMTFERPRLAHWIPLAIAVSITTALSSEGAAIVVSAGNHVLLPDTSGQQITLQVDNRSGGPLDVDNLTFLAAIGDGGPGFGGTPVPSISAADFTTGTAFSAGNEVVFEQALQDGIAQFLVFTFGGPVTLEPGVRTLATLTVDTTGFNAADGPWSLNLEGAFGPVTGTTGYSLNLVDYDVERIAGSISVVPEPETWALGSGLVLLGFAAWRRAVRR